jgi:hypothetical protein
LAEIRNRRSFIRHLEWIVDGNAIGQTDLQYLEGCLKL